MIVTSGFVRRMGDAFRKEFVNISYSARKAIVSEYADTKDNGLTVSGKYTGQKPVLIPQLDYCTNDVWELAAAYGTDNNFPIVLRCAYGTGHISVITIPDDMGDLYNYPSQVLGVIRGLCFGKIPVVVEGPAGVQLFVYDNDKVIVRSDMPYSESVSLKLKDGYSAVKNLITGEKIAVVDNGIRLQMTPSVNYVLEFMK